MCDKEINQKLKQLNIEDFIWIIYIGIICASWYSNYLERNYYIKKDINSKNKYQKINEIIFSILLVVYLYFLKSSYDDLRKLKPNDSKKKKELVYLSFLASLLITISGGIFLYISFVNDNLDVEIAFN